MIVPLLSLAFADDPVCSAWTASELVTEVAEMPSTESSGVAVIQDGFLTHDDSTGSASLYQFDLLGNFLREITLEGATNTDWEDMAVAPCDEGECAFIADIGDNDNERDHVTIWRAPVVNADVYAATACDLVYDDGAPHDAEALLYFPDGSVRIVTKDALEAKVYRSEPLRCDGTPQSLTQEATLALGEAITGGAVSADGTLVALRSLTHGWVWRGCVLDWTAPPIDLLFVGEEQGESLAFAPDESLYSTSEGEAFELHHLPCSDTSEIVCSDCGCGGQGAVGGLLLASAALLGASRRRR